MFDLFRSREKATRYLLGGLLFAVAASMVITLIPGFGSNTGTTGADPTILAEIGNEKLSGQEAQQQFQQITNQPNINPDMLSAYFPQFVEQMIMQRAALYEAERMGLTVTDDELLWVCNRKSRRLFRMAAWIRPWWNNTMFRRARRLTTGWTACASS